MQQASLTKIGLMEVSGAWRLGQSVLLGQSLSFHRNSIWYSLKKPVLKFIEHMWLGSQFKLVYCIMQCNTSPVYVTYICNIYDMKSCIDNGGELGLKSA